MPDTAVNEQIRLLRCDDDLTLEELPWYEGPADYDTALQYALSKHRFPNGEPHKGRLITVEKRAWDLDNLRRAIIEQIWSGSKGVAELDATFYDVKNNFRDDAFACYKAHGRPTDSCPDFNSSAKILRPDTKAERKEAGLTMQGAPVIHLCSFCPMRPIMEQKARGDR